MTTTTTDLDHDAILRTMLGTWEKFPQSERIDFYKATTKAYENPQTGAQASDIFGDIGNKVIATDKAFIHIRDKFDDFAAANKGRYPELVTIYVPGWKKLYDDWFSAFKSSQDYASRYVDVILELVGRVDLHDPGSVAREQARLKRFSEEGPPSVIPVDYEKAFKKLREDVTRFQTQFNKYLVDQGGIVKEEIRRLTAELDVLVKRLNELNKAVDDWTIALASTSWTGLIGTLISGIGLAVKTAERNAKQREVDSKKSEIERANEAQAGLTKMVTGFAALGGDFDIIDGTLQQLTQIWSDMRAASVKFSHLLERAVNGGDDADEFQLALESAKKAADPLYNSLWNYATKVDGHRRAYHAPGGLAERKV
ncbi:hypothetical protein BDZ94DRAFT_1304696 [Collybia nuda]|uniref:Uncharacterized protein n=1 Tax=Collybia nuda TaxID=64659 RepID=A0A9P6CJG5_9AGAR|nr:hypothetical protein BDZ94DRAFT_1304696 [Collybia nuda]